MAYKPKPELEEGNYIAYTDEPDTVVDAGSGGGGGGGTGEPYIMSFEFMSETEIADYTNSLGIGLNGKIIRGFAPVDTPSGHVYVKEVEVNGGEVISSHIPESLTIASASGCFCTVPYGDTVIANTSVLLIVPNSYCAEIIKDDLEPEAFKPSIKFEITAV